MNRWLMLLSLLWGPVLAQDVKVRLEPVVTGLRSPLFLTHSGDGSGDLFVVQQTGQIRVLVGGKLREQPFLDIASLISTGGERGLLGLAFHPDYSRNGYFFVNYTDRGGQTVVARYQANQGSRQAITSSETVVMRIPQPFANHNGGMIAFGPDGFLYLGMGDGGSGGDPQNHGQRLDSLLGKMLRIDVDRLPYTIPADNPRLPEARPEIWAYGLRNPWRFSFDRKSGDLWIADVGQNAWEEVHWARSGDGGQNYGWRLMEGNECFNPRTNCPRNGLTMPVHTYGRNDGQSITGGYVYRGPSIPSLQGRYLFTDFNTGNLWSLRQEGERWVRSTLLGGLGQGIASFGEDQKGELYLLNLIRGEIWRLGPG